jgi:hypothetical protein
MMAMENSGNGRGADTIAKHIEVEARRQIFRRARTTIRTAGDTGQRAKNIKSKWKKFGHAPAEKTRSKICATTNSVTK